MSITCYEIVCGMGVREMWRHTQRRTSMEEPTRNHLPGTLLSREWGRSVCSEDFTITFGLQM